MPRIRKATSLALLALGASLGATTA
ncbi:MAG: hypothetical protein RL148_1797, partial [Planctomycetota bacterium]